VGGSRELTPEERELCARARRHAFVLYEGKTVAHRSCGIALAETFGLPTRPYQALRRGGITGEGECGAMKAGELVLGELLGDPDPRGPVTSDLRAAVVEYQADIRRRLAAAGILPAPDAPDTRCNTLTRPRGDFMGDARKSMCTSIAAEVAEATCEAALRHGARVEIPELPET
jgi:hypothetical protein